SAVGQNAQAQGDVNATKADVETARAAQFQAMAQVKQARSKIKELEAAVQFAKSDFSRYEFAFQNKAVTKQQYDRAQQNIDMAEAQLQQGHDSLLQSLKQEAQAKSSILQAEGKLQKSHGTVTTAVAAGQQSLIDKEEFASAQSELMKQQAMLDKAKLNLSYCQIVAPVAGRIGKKSVEIGQRIEPGQALMSIVQPDMWVSANFKETQMSKMKKGQRAEVKIDAFPDLSFKGYVDSFSPASGAKFSILPPDNASGNFTKVVQRIPVKIVFDKKEAAAFSDRLAPGMSCVVNVFFK
ncbi:MAG: HlyD family secretion protein, partial [Candidatus Obscuribacterales bacterium]|nr:HlyD family secretion protein [Candidatus Obscuribacterales bacterium]